MAMNYKQINDENCYKNLMENNQVYNLNNKI